MDDRERLIRYTFYAALAVLALAMFASLPHISAYAAIDRLLMAAPWRWMIGVAGPVVVVGLATIYARRMR